MGDLVPEGRQGRVELLVEFFLPTVEVVKELLVSIGILLRLANHAFEIIELSSQLIPVVREFAHIQAGFFDSWVLGHLSFGDDRFRVRDQPRLVTVWVHPGVSASCTLVMWMTFSGRRRWAAVL